jgi:plastocyanin
VTFRRWAVITASLATLLVVATSLPSAAVLRDVPMSVVTTAPAAQFHGYVAPVIVTEKGGEVIYVNLDVAQHDVVQDTKADGIAGPRKKPWCVGYGKKSCPVFWTKRIGLGQNTEILGLESVKPGKTYSFFCTLHPGMKGTLVVRP